MNDCDEIAVAGRGEATRHEPELFDPQSRTTIRFADPAAWITGAAIVRATQSGAGLSNGSTHDVGVVVISDDGPAASMAQEHANWANGFSSPLRYIAANPGSLAGVACIACGFRGPTLNFAMRPRDGVPVGLLVGRAWLHRGIARAVVLASFTATAGPGATARALLLLPRAALPGHARLDASDIEWIGQARR